MTVELVLPKSVKRITIVQTARAGEPTPAPQEIFSRSSGKAKKQTRGLRIVGKWARRYNEALGKMSDVYLGRHARSNQKRRDGWFRDYAYNMTKANRSALKKLRLPVFRMF